MKICFAASSGGHFEEIAQLKKIKEGNKAFLVTEKGGRSGEELCDDVYYVPQINRREMFFLFKFIKLFSLARSILRYEKPDCIISTGALATCPLCIVGKMMGIKIIYIESFARVTSPSLTGRLMYRIADLFIVQWKELLDVYPLATYAGSVF